ncbi:MAG TPA: cytochrome b N-terminal domain-containing protein [Rhodothermia bacterium]|nr:cytochrome b N-terminal domain-containing protein [Rhodothermia bacterium]
MNDGRKSNLFTWLDERFELTPLIEFARKKSVPVHRSTFLYYLGGITLLLFIIMVSSGILLLMYYQPGTESSYESVRFIMTKVKFGWLFRSIHHWSANLMILFAVLHMLSTLFTRAYRKPRELTWVTGFILLCLALGLGFSGYLLPWDELAFFATKVGTDIAGAVPLIGEPAKEFLRAGSDVTGATLTRFYAFHVALLPAIFTVFLTLHLAFVQRQGMHAPTSYERLPESRRKDIPFFPNFVLRDVLIWMVVINIILYLAVFWPSSMGVKADPFTPAPEGIKPEWYYMFMFQTLKVLPAHILSIPGETLGVLFFAAAALLWMLIPFWELRRRSDSGLRPMTVVGIAAVTFVIVMTVWGYLV